MENGKCTYVLVHGTCICEVVRITYFFHLESKS